MEMKDLNLYWLTPEIKNGIKVVFILFFFWVLNRLIKLGLSKTGIFHHATASTRVLLRTCIQILLLLMCALVVMDTLGISITPLLASLGVGSLAVALALQDTLNNFFSGLYLLIDKPVRIGDNVKIDDNEGIVKRIGWRTTRIELSSGSMLILPNSKLSLSNLLNYDYPNSEVAVTIPLGVSYSSDLEIVEKVTLQTAKQVLASVDGAVKNFEPFIRFNQFGDFRVNFNVTLRAQTYSQSFFLKHVFMKAIHKAYKEAKIEIPFPQRMIQIQKD